MNKQWHKNCVSQSPDFHCDKPFLLTLCERWQH